MALVQAGDKSVTDTAAALSATSITCEETIITADSSNTNDVFVGLSDVDDAGLGYRLKPGKSIPINDSPSRIYAVVSTGTETISWIAQNQISGK